MLSRSAVLAIAACLLAGCSDAPGPAASSSTSSSTSPGPVPMWYWFNDTLEIRGVNLGAVPGEGQYENLPGDRNCVDFRSIQAAGLSEIKATATAGQNTDEAPTWNLGVFIFSPDAGPEFEVDGPFPLGIETGNLTLGDSEIARIRVVPGELPPSASVSATVNLSVALRLTNLEALDVDLAGDSGTSSCG